MKNLFKLALCGLAFVLAACTNGGDGIDDNKPTGITYKSCEDKMEIKGEAQQVTITITADAAWEAKVSQTRIATISAGERGEAGTHDIVLNFAENDSPYSRNLTLSVKVAGVAENVTICRFTQLSVNAKGTDANVNRNFTWPFLDKYYLWNKDLRDAGAPKWDQAYDDFLDSALSSITTNTMDGYLYTPASGAPYWIYYSYIQRTTPTAQSMTRAEKAYYQGYGVSMYPLQFAAGSVHLAVEFVYPGSPAEKAGLKRGDFIGKINGVAINEGNYWELMRDNFLYEVPVGTVLKADVQEFNWAALKLATTSREVTMTSASYCENPVIFYDTISYKSTTDESQKVHIGYMVYTSFDAAFDDEIKKAFDALSTAATESGLPLEYLVLDLRYNGGGSVASCCYLSSLIAGNKALNGGQPKVFMYSRFNDERMAEQGRNPKDYTTYKRDDFDKAAAAAYNFPFKEVYVIGTYDTASSSEMLINALRGIGMKVTLVGGTTNGKNVGMEVFNTQSSGSAIDGNHYIFAPISFQSYNCNGESNYDNGFTPEGNLNCAESYDGMPPVDWGTVLVDIPGDRPGEFVSVMPDFFSVALNDILTKEFAATSGIKRLSQPSASSMPMSVKRMATPARKQDIFRQNAWVLAEE